MLSRRGGIERKFSLRARASAIFPGESWFRNMTFFARNFRSALASNLDIVTWRHPATMLRISRAHAWWTRDRCLRRRREDLDKRRWAESPTFANKTLRWALHLCRRDVRYVNRSERPFKFKVAWRGAVGGHAPPRVGGARWGGGLSRRARFSQFAPQPRQPRTCNVRTRAPQSDIDDVVAARHRHRYYNRRPARTWRRRQTQETGGWRNGRGVAHPQGDTQRCRELS